MKDKETKNTNDNVTWVTQAEAARRKGCTRQYINTMLGHPAYAQRIRVQGEGRSRKIAWEDIENLQSRRAYVGRPNAEKIRKLDLIYYPEG